MHLYTKSKCRGWGLLGMWCGYWHRAVEAFSWGMPVATGTKRYLKELTGKDN